MGVADDSAVATASFLLFTQDLEFSEVCNADIPALGRL